MVKLWQRNESGRRLPNRAKARAEQLLGRVAARLGRRFSEVGLTYVTPGVSRTLNRRYRRHNWVTDVLSFTYQSKPVVGELVICLRQAELQARRADTSLMTELDRLLVHGYLHLAGYDHLRAAERRVMRALEDRLLQR
jgi:probable rRNA maturation factor